MCAYLLINLSIFHPSVFLVIYLSIDLFVRPSDCASVRLFICVYKERDELQRIGKKREIETQWENSIQRWRLGVTTSVPLNYIHVLSHVMKYFFKMYSGFSGWMEGGDCCFKVYLRKNCTNWHSNSSICVWIHKIKEILHKSNISILSRCLVTNGINSSLQPLFLSVLQWVFSCLLRWFRS